MTVFAYRDGILASDSQVLSRSWTCTASFQKIGQRTIDGKTYMFAATGETAFCAKFMRWMQSDDGFPVWLKDGTGHPRIEPTKNDETCIGVVFYVGEDRCTRFEGDYPPFDLHAPFFAFGTGEQVALGALAMGAYPVRAIEIACEYDVLSNGPILCEKAEQASTDTYNIFAA